jgi:hypothetical protein
LLLLLAWLHEDIGNAAAANQNMLCSHFSDEKYRKKGIRNEPGQQIHC